MTNLKPIPKLYAVDKTEGQQFQEDCLSVVRSFRNSETKPSHSAVQQAVLLAYEQKATNAQAWAVNHIQRFVLTEEPLSGGTQDDYRRAFQDHAKAT